MRASVDHAAFPSLRRQGAGKRVGTLTTRLKNSDYPRPLVRGEKGGPAQSAEFHVSRLCRSVRP